MKDIVWGKVLSIEVDEIDEDHKKLQQRILEADKTMTDEDTSLLERWLTELILTEDMRLGSYLSQVIWTSPRIICNRSLSAIVAEYQQGLC